MKNRTWLFAVAGIVSAALAFPLAVSAEGPGPGECMHDADRGGPGPDGEGGRGGEGFKHFALHHLERLHDDLKLTSGQEGAWKAYSEAELARFAKKPTPDHEGQQNLSAPERIEKMIADLKRHQDELSVALVETRKFYVQLTPEQQTIFDRETALHHPPRGGEGHKAPPPQP